MELPLFPLNTVLFPGAPLALHIFEERYKSLVRRCLDEQCPFGVLLIRSGEEVGGPAEPFEVGTTVRIVRVEHLDEGRMKLACVGERRFRLDRTTSKGPYLVGEVSVLECIDREGDDVRDLADTAGALYAEYYRLYLAASNQWSRHIEMPGDPSQLADFIAFRMNAGLWTKQRLLEELSVKVRLEVEVEALSDAIRDLTPKVQAIRSRRWRVLGSVN